MRKRLAESEARAQRVAELEAEVSAADPSDTSAWDVLVARARSLGAKVSGAQESAKGTKPAREEKREAFHRYRDERGRKILVGRGGADNDRLTTEVARPHDLWLHVKNKTGAHVVVPLDKGQTCPAETLVDAATLAAHFSDARGEAVCEVSYVPRRYVRKPKGSAPGAVTYDHEKVLVLRVQALRLERLLATRDE
jgi:predicted ribosome quality control (RQC) complex YloA/Tae2 family protein